MVSTGPVSRFPFDTARVVCRLLSELVVEILTYFGDLHPNTLSAKNVWTASRFLDAEDVERSTVPVARRCPVGIA